MSALLEDLEDMRTKLRAAIHWNFGVVGNDPVCNARLDDVQRLEEKLKAESLEEFKYYQNKYY
jgi:hypothetical protein